MENGYRLIFWGLLFATFHINLGSIPILPQFVAWLIVAVGVGKLRQKYSSAAFIISGYCAQFAVLISFSAGIYSLYQVDSAGGILISVVYPVVFGILELILEVKIIEGSIEYFYSMDARKTAKDYIQIMRTYTLLFTANTIAECIQLTFSFTDLMTLIPIIGILLRLRFIILMHRLENDKINIEENKNLNDSTHIDTLM